MWRLTCLTWRPLPWSLTPEAPCVTPEGVTIGAQGVMYGASGVTCGAPMDSMWRLMGQT